MPNTNNSLEANFNDLKTKLRNHSGPNLANKKKIISWYLFYKKLYQK